MSEQKKTLLKWIDEDRDRIIDFLSRFIQAKSPNPPGDTRSAAKHICDFLDEQGISYQMIAPQAEMPNIVGAFEGGSPGRNLVLNGHIDVFPVGDATGWTHDPWGGKVVDDRIYGRGAADMKAGTTASVFAFTYLHRIREKLNGKLTLTCVSDEETFGPWGARYLMDNHPEVHGDCCLNGEPSSPYAIRFGEKGPLWLRFTVITPGAHGAYAHLSPSATKISARLIEDLEALSAMDVPVPQTVALALKHGAGAIDRAQGQGASKVVERVTVNIGVIRGGLKVNMIPGSCSLEVDIRLPVGLEKQHVMAELEKITARYPEVSREEVNYTPPSWCDPNGEMLGYIRNNAKALKGLEPRPVVSPGGTDARLWRYRDIPAYVYGPSPRNVGSHDEHVEIDEFFHIVQTHVLCAYDYLSRG